MLMLSSITIVWDVRRAKEPVHRIPQLPALYDETQMALSPDGNVLVTGVSAAKQSQTGTLAFFNTQTWRMQHEEGLPLLFSKISRKKKREMTDPNRWGHRHCWRKSDCADMARQTESTLCGHVQWRHPGLLRPQYQSKGHLVGRR